MAESLVVSGALRLHAARPDPHCLSDQSGRGFSRRSRIVRHRWRSRPEIGARRLSRLGGARRLCRLGGLWGLRRSRAGM